MVCAECSTPLTGAWSKSWNGARHAYYWRPKKECTSLRKSVRRDVLEDEFEQIARSLIPAPQVAGLLTDMVHDAWHQRGSQRAARKLNLQQEHKRLIRTVDELRARVTDISSPTVMKAFEKRVEELEREKLEVEEKIPSCGKAHGSYEASVRTAVESISNPWKLWAFGGYTHKRTLLKLAFADPVAWKRSGGFRTANLTLPFKVLGGIPMSEKVVVEGTGFEPV